MSAVYGMQQTLKGATRADKAQLKLDGTVVALAQNSQFQFSQNVAMLFEIGSNDVYYVGGRAQGTCTIGRIVGPAGAAGSLATGLGDLCGDRPVVSLDASGCSGDATTYTLEGCILTVIAVTVSAQDVVVNEQLQLMFVNLDIS